ncbi:embryo-specific protein ATS3B-like isoform X3 [Trifolium pratense]|uniref:embryo-specific protein ATS3B-like isoform X3 n=1 Tax=Trifolium pratense TaxID=57577 RepID=UPI001E6925DF|nr:embryo-specific protein ATS3B-like isoform X3 [Trifolium pratense]
MKALTLILTFAIIVAFSQTLVTHSYLQRNLYSMLNHTQQHINETISCVYQINVKTSCHSPPLTTDAIGISIGDAEGNEVLAQLDGPDDSETFKQCSTISFEILGPCVGKICQLYLFRNGTDGWMPETVTALYNDYPPVTFNYNIFIPQGVSSGFNYCDDKN